MSEEPMKRLPEFETRHPLTYYMEHAERGDHKLVKEVFDLGLIDDLQAFSRKTAGI